MERVTILQIFWPISPKGWPLGVKYEILSEKMPVPRELTSRVGSNVGEPEECIKSHKKIALNNGGPGENQKLWRWHTWFLCQICPWEWDERGVDGKTSKKSDNSWVREIPSVKVEKF